MSLEPHQQRMVDEWRQLDERYEKLLNFIEGNNLGSKRDVFATLPETEQKLIKRQLEAMYQYRYLLRERIIPFAWLPVC